ncbi:MAG: tetratricopeptide repeat protein [Acidobacteria bacterium]|nr:tetratricopeptide repeat protein [Acidobacteriota bacterium]
MAEREEIQRAIEYFHKAYSYQMNGQLVLAVRFYKRSIETFPTAEAHTFLGWTYSFMGRLDEAIAECQQAIEVDPDFGNPYNDIGAYLIEKGQPDEAVPWLQKAMVAKRYESYHYPHYNLGRVYVAKEMYNKALEEFQKALEIQPDYLLARQTIEEVKKYLN